MRSLKKLLGFAAIVVGFVAVVHWLAEKSVSHKLSTQTAALTEEESAVFFVGSSRVRASIEPHILAEGLDHVPVFNMGVSGSTFLGNCLMASYLIQRPGPKTICMELSPLVPRLPSVLLDFFGQVNFNALRATQDLTSEMTTWNRGIVILKVMERILSVNNPVKEDIRVLMGGTRNRYVGTMIGFDATDTNEWHDVSTFLLADTVYGSGVAVDPTIYVRMIGRLNQLAKEHDAHLLFFVPLTSVNPYEQDLVVTLFRSLPAELKLTYTDELKKQVLKPEHLKDRNHLNLSGAKAYSRLLGPILNSKLKHSGSAPE